MAKNSAEGNKGRTARYRAGLAARGIRPVQLYAPEGAHALLRQAAGLMSREQDPLEPRQAMRQASSANDPGEGHGGQSQEEHALAVMIKAVKAELAKAQEAGRQAEAMAVARAEAAERAREAVAAELQVAEVLAAQARMEVERFQKPGMRGRVVRWLIR